MFGINENVSLAMTETPALTSTADTYTVPALPGPEPLEVIGGFTVHPAASKFPLMVGKDFDELVEAVHRAGTVTAVEMHNGQLIDGRNRVRAVEVLRSRGIEIELPTIEWRPVGDETVEEHIYAVNVHRRHLTDDQRVVLATLFLPLIRQRTHERQAATRFGRDGRPAAALTSAPPVQPAGGAPRTGRDKDAASAVGQLAMLSNVSRHKALQAAKLYDRVSSGDVPPESLDAVTSGRVPLRDVVPGKQRRAARQAGVTVSGHTKIDECVVVDEPAVTEDEVRRRWERFKMPFAISDHSVLRRVLSRIIAEEQRQFDRTN